MLPKTDIRAFLPFCRKIGAKLGLIVTAWFSPNLFHLLLWEMQHKRYILALVHSSLLNLRKGASHFQYSVSTLSNISNSIPQTCLCD